MTQTTTKINKLISEALMRKLKKQWKLWKEINEECMEWERRRGW